MFKRFFVLIFTISVTGIKLNLAAQEKIPIPEFYGIYIVSGEKLVALKDAMKEKRVALRADYSYSGIKQLSGILALPNSFFLVYGDQFKSYLPYLRLARYKFVKRLLRNASSPDYKGESYVANVWDMEIDTPMNTGPVKGQAELFRLVPVSPLSDGVYVLYSEIDPMAISPNDIMGDFIVGKVTNIQPTPTKEFTPHVPSESAEKITSLEDELEQLGNLPIASDEEFEKFTQIERSRSAEATMILKIRELRGESEEASKSHKWQEDIDANQQILAIDPKNWGSLVMLANDYTNIGNPDKGLAYATKALRKIRHNFLFGVVADAYGKKGNKEKALLWLEKALKGGFTMSITNFDETFPQYRNDPQYNALLKEYGIISTDSAIQESSQQIASAQNSQSKNAEQQKLEVFITDQWKQIIQMPPTKRDWKELTYLTITGKYDDYSSLYLLGVNRRSLAGDALTSASKFLKKGDLDNTKKYANLASLHYIESNGLFKSAEQIFEGSVAITAHALEAIYRSSRDASKYGWFLMCGPKCYEVADYVFLMADFTVDYGLEGVDEAKKNLIAYAFVKTLLETSGFSSWIEKRTTYLIGEAGLYDIMDKTNSSPEFQEALIEILLVNGAYANKKLAEIGAKTLVQNSLDFVKGSSNLKPVKY